MTVALSIPVPTQEEFRAHWDHVRSHFSVDEFFVIGDGFISSAAELPTHPLILLQPDNGLHVRGKTSLREFQHPKDATYLFGPDESPLLPEFLGGRIPEYRVYVPTDSNRDMFSFVTFAVVMWDRRLKQ